MCTAHRKQMLSAGCTSGLCPFSPRFLKEKKEHRKPVRWYTRLIVYGNPGRVVNGYAPGIPVLICGFGVVARGAVAVGFRGGCGVRPRSSQHGRGGAPHISSAPTQGHPSPGRSASSSLRIGERPCDTLRAHPENAAAPAQYPSAERRYRPKVTSGCPKRSEGGCPCRNEDEYRFPCGSH